MSNHPTSLAKSRQAFIQDDHKNPMEIITYPEATVKRLGQVDHNTDVGIFGPVEGSSKLVNLEKYSELTSDGFQNLTFP